MAKTRNLGGQIIELRNQGKSYRDIETLLSCSKRTINYHCNKNDLLDTGKKRHKISPEKQKEIYDYCQNNSSADAQLFFKASKSTIEKYKKRALI